MEVQERLAAQHRLFLDSIEEEVAHELLLALPEADLLLERLVVQHGIGEPKHVEHDIQLLCPRPRENVLRIVEVGGEDRRGDTELEVRVFL